MTDPNAKPFDMDFYAAFILGLVGSLHCAGMCGPLAMALPATRGSAISFSLGRTAYNLGRIATYCLLGVISGAVGTSLAFVGFQRWLSMALGLLLLCGLIFSRKLALWRPVTVLVSHLKTKMSSALRHRSFASMTLLGLLNGLLPCGLVYVACLGATATSDIVAGAGYMATFGLGTLPMMLGLSLSGKLVPVPLRVKWRRAIPLSVVLLASLLILRGLSLGIPYVSPDLSTRACCHR